VTLLIDTAEEITPEWFAGVLGAAGLDVSVRATTVERVGTGQIGANYRVTPTYASAPARAPSTLVVKLGAGDAAMRSRVSQGYRNEVGFYRDIAATVAIDTPHCWHAEVSDDWTVCTLVFDDLHPASPGVQAHGCTVDAARASLVNLAGLHGPRWNDPTLLDLEFVSRSTPDTAEFVGEIYRGANEQFADRYRGRLGDADLATMRDVGDALATWQMMRPEPYAVVHGDYRLDNLMFSPDGRVTALDWQTVSVAPAARDVAYFLGTCLEPGLRRTHERELLDAYLGALASHGVGDYGAEQAYEDYRLGQLHAPMITVLGAIYATSAPTEQSNGMFLAMARRSAAAIRDLDTLALL